MFNIFEIPNKLDFGSDWVSAENFMPKKVLKVIVCFGENWPLLADYTKNENKN